MRRVSFGLILVLGAASSVELHAQQTTPPVPPRRQATVRCKVAPGPVLRDCRLLAPADLAPAKQASLIEFQESLPACVIGSAVVGAEIERTFGFADSPRLLDPALKNPQVITNPDWRERPSPALIASVYPLHARAAKISGHVQIKCTVSAAGAAENCQVISEDPAGEHSVRPLCAHRWHLNSSREPGTAYQRVALSLSCRWILPGDLDLEFHLEACWVHSQPSTGFRRGRFSKSAFLGERARTG